MSGQGHAVARSDLAVGLKARDKWILFDSLPRSSRSSEFTSMRAPKSLCALPAVFAALNLASAPDAFAQETFYRGRSVMLVVGYSAGGGYDQYARLLARHFGRHIAGNPSVIVQNMPGAASMTAARYLDAAAPKDGTVITTFDPGLITESFASPELYRIKFSNFQWIGTLLRDIRICYAWGATGIRSWDDMMKRKEFLIGTTAKGSNAFLNGAVLRKVFHAPVRQIAGYPGSMPQDWIVNMRINTLVRFAAKRPSDMPESVPYVMELARTQEQRDLLAVINASGELGRPFIVARQVPADRVKILRVALAATLQDEAFLSDARKQNLPLDPVSGEEAEKIIATIYAASPELARKVKDVLE
jgi:hypothetical protein